MRSQRFAPEFKDEALRQVLERGGSWTGTDLHRRVYFWWLAKPCSWKGGRHPWRS